MSDQNRIVITGDLEEFQAEIKPSMMVRISLSSQQQGSGIGPVYEHFYLHMQAVNPQGEIIWLFYSQKATKIGFGPGDYFPATEATIAAGMLTLLAALKTHMTALGYEVRGGKYAIPEEVKPTKAHLPARWIKQDDGGYTVTWEAKDV